MSIQFFKLYLILISISYVYSSISTMLLAAFPNLKLENYKYKTRYIGACNLGKTDKKNTFDFKYQALIDDDGFETISGYTNAPNTIKILKATYTASYWKNNAFNDIYNRTKTNPCTDLLFYPPMREIFNVNADCVVAKKNYSMNNFSVEKFWKTIIGEKFIIGRIKGKVAFFTKTGCIFCAESIADALPLTNKTESTLN